MVVTTEHVGSQLSGCDDSLALGYAPQHRVKVCLLHDLQIFVRGIVLDPSDACRGIEEGYTPLLQEGHDAVLVEPFLLRQHEVVQILEEAESENAPHVVDVVGIIERHAPPFLRRRERAQHQQLSMLWQKRLEGMALYRLQHPVFGIIFTHDDAKIRKINETMQLFFKKYLAECENLRNFAARKWNFNSNK